MKLNDVVVIGEAVKELLSKPMKAKLAFRLTIATKGVRELNNEFNSTREELVKKYGVPSTEQQGMYTFKGEDSVIFTNEIQGLLDEEVGIKDFKINLKDIENIELTGTSMVALEPYIVDDSIEEKADPPPGPSTLHP